MKMNNTLSFLLYVVLFFLNFICIDSYKADINLYNFGTKFVYVQEITNVNHYWQHVIKIELINVEHLKYVLIPKDIDTHINSLEKHYNILNGVYNEIKNISEHIINLFPKEIYVKKFVNTNKHNRGLLNFVGYTLKSLFGVATEEQTDNLLKVIKIVVSKQDEITNNIAKMPNFLGSFVTQTDKRFTNILQLFNLLNNKTNNMLEYESEIINNFSIKMINLINLLEHGNKLLFHLNNLYHAYNEIVKGSLSEYLIRKKDFEYMLGEIRSHIELKHPLYDIDLSMSYKNIKTIAFLYNNYIYINLFIPLNIVDVIFHTYEIITFPVVIYNTSHHTIIEKLPKYFAISSHNNLYTTALEFDHNTNEIKFTKIAKIMFTNYTTCVLALFLNHNNINDIKTWCKFNLIKEVTNYTNIIQLPPRDIIIYGYQDIYINCKNNKKLIQPCLFCIVKIDCHCNIQTNNYFLLEFINECQIENENNFINVTVYHPLNLGLLLQYFDKNDLQNINGETLSSKIIPVKIPAFKFYENSENGVLNKDKANHYNLEKLVELSKSEQIIHSNPFEEALIASFDPTNYSNIIIYFLLSIIACNILFTIYLFLKYRNILVIIAGINHLNKVEGLPEYLIYSQTTSKPIEYSKIFIDKIELIMLSIIIIILLTRVFVKIWKTKRHTVLCVEISDGKESFLVNLLSLHVNILKYKYSLPKINNFIITGNFMRSIKIVWDIKTLKFNNNSYAMPETLKISIFEYNKINRIIKNEMHNQYYLKVNKYMYILEANGLETSSNSLYPNLNNA